MVEAEVRVVEGMDEEGELRAVEADWVRNVVTVPRQSTTVPKTSVRRAWGGLVRDMIVGN